MIDQEKYIEAILYFITECGNRHLGKTKLMKLLYYLDFDHFEQHGKPVTGDAYHKFQYGPLPSEASRMIRIMEAEGLVEQRPSRVINYTQSRLIPLREANLNVFSEIEITTLKAVCEEWRDVSRQDIVEATHSEEPWIAVDDGDEIPYVYAYYRDKFPESEPIL